MIFSVADFALTSACLVSEIYMCWYVITNSYYLPIYIVVELIIDCIKFLQEFLGFYKTITLTRRLKKLPDVEASDLEDATCLICRVEIKKGKQIGCGHVYHYGCLRVWIEKNLKKFCPKCRKPIVLEETAEHHRRKLKKLRNERKADEEAEHITTIKKIT